MADGFLSRWSKRKAGKDIELEQTTQESAELTPPEAPKAPPPPATIEDVEKIDRFDPDFSAFMRPDVDPAVQQAALKKMFSDPHFNVMDGLDIYIDDYSNPEPLSPGMLERMVQSEMLNLFSKTPDPLIPDEKQVEQKTVSAQSTEKLLEARDQTDLTSTDSAAQTKSADLDEIPVKPAQNKT
jgi:Protein of unknown function (DUF3306)